MNGSSCCRGCARSASRLWKFADWITAEVPADFLGDLQSCFRPFEVRTLLPAVDDLLRDGRRKRNGGSGWADTVRAEVI